MEDQRTQAIAEYEKLNTHLKALRTNYVSAKRSGSDLLDMLGRTAGAILPAGVSFRRFIDLFSGTGASGADKSVVEVTRALAGARQIERKLLAYTRMAVAQQAQMEQRAGAVGEMKKGQDALLRELRKKVDEGTATRDEFVRIKALQEQVRELGVKQNTLVQATVRFDKDQQKQLDAIRKNRQEFSELASEQLRASRAMEIAAKAAKGMLTATGTLFAVRQEQAINRTLLEANSSLDTRRDLLEQALVVQLRTGDSLGEIAELMRVLRSQTQLYGKDLTETLTTASKLHQALGAGADDVAVLLNVSRQLRVPLVTVGDEVANIIDKTSLGTRDAIAIVAELRDVIASYNLSGDRLVAATRNVVALEEALRAVGGEAGSAVKLISSFSDMTKKGGLGLAFGAGGPDVATDPRRFRELTKHITEFLTPWRQNMYVFPRLAESFGLSAREAQNLIDAQAKLAETEGRLADRRLTLDERFREISARTGVVYGQLLNNIKALLVTGLTPLTFVVDQVNGLVVKLREGLRELLPAWTRVGVQVVVMTTAVGLMVGAVVKGLRAFALVRKALETIASFRQPGALLVGRGAAAGLPGRAAATTAQVLGGGIVAEAQARTTGHLGKLVTLLTSDVVTRREAERRATRAFEIFERRNAGQLVGKELEAAMREAGRQVIVRPSLGDVGRGLVRGTRATFTHEAMSGRALREAMANRAVGTSALSFVLANIPAIVGAAVPLVILAAAAYGIHRLIQGYTDKAQRDIIRDMERLRRVSAQDVGKTAQDMAARALDRKVTPTNMDDFLQKAANERTQLELMFRQNLKADPTRESTSLAGVKEGMRGMERALKTRLEQAQATQAREAPTATVERRSEIADEIKALQALYARTLEENKQALAGYKQIAAEMLREQQQLREKDRRHTEVLKQTSNALEFHNKMLGPGLLPYIP